MTNTWEDKVLAATGGTRIGAMISAALNEDTDRLPSFAGSACCTSDGFLMAGFTGRGGDYHGGALAGSITEYIANVRGVASHCKLNKDDRTSFYAVMKGWVTTDYRSKQEWF